MSTLPLTEAILLEIHQSLGGKPYQTNKKTKFASAQDSFDAHGAMGTEILEAIFDAFDMDPPARQSAVSNLMEFGNAYKFIELKTWTFDADTRQILWAILGHFYVPSLARRIGFWSMAERLDPGMPGGRFWYLPEPRESNGQTELYMPVAHVVDWLLDLLGTGPEQFADGRDLATQGDHDALRRSLYNWRDVTSIRPDTIVKYFDDKVALEFEGAFVLDVQRPPAEQFAEALAFVQRRKFDCDKLRIEIPMMQEGHLEAVLAGQADETQQAVFVQCIAERYTAPSMKIVRQRLLVARMVQDGYVRLLKFLCPGVDSRCADMSQNKVLQLIVIYRLVYNLTVAAPRQSGLEGQAVEDAWFERQLPPSLNHLFISILPSRRAYANDELALWLTRHFFDSSPGDALEDHWSDDDDSLLKLAQTKLERRAAFAREIHSEFGLVERMKASSPWRALHKESRFWVVRQVALDPIHGSVARLAARKRLRELASTPFQTVAAISLELGSYLDGEQHGRPKNVSAIVEALLLEAENSEGYLFWKAVVLQYRAKHLLACNDFDGALKFFRAALEAGTERNFGPLRGEVARESLAVELANSKLIVNNHQKYYREILAGGLWMEDGTIPPLADIARRATGYFWETLYKPYPGVQAKVHLNEGLMRQIAGELIPLFEEGDSEGMKAWIKRNRSLLKSNLPDVEGNSVLMLLMKMHNSFLRNAIQMRYELASDLETEMERFDAMLGHWKRFLMQMAQESPGQVNLPDLKAQTPLMLASEAGDTEFVAVLLVAGADPDLQDVRGQTALHSAVKSCVDTCVNALLEYPCALDKVTAEGRSPLHTAGWNGNLHATRRLLQLAPALAWQRDHFGQTPLEHLEYLLEHPAAFQQLSDHRKQEGCLPPEHGNLVCVSQLLEQALPVSVQSA